LVITPRLRASPAAQRMGSGIDRRQTDHFRGEPGIALHQFGRLASLGDKLRDEMHGNARTPEHRITAENFRIADGKAPGAKQVAW
jgi:hypothetical protein